MRRLRHYLSEPVDGASTAFFRIVFGLLVAIDALRFMKNGWVDEYLVRPEMHFKYIYLDFVRAWPDGLMHAHFILIALAALLVGLGLFYRIAAPLLFATYGWFFFVEQSIYMNHYYLIMLVCFLLVLVPADRLWSLDAWRRGGTDPPVVPRWSVLILRFQLFVMYFYGGIAKLNPDWLRGEPMYGALVRQTAQVPDIALQFPPALLAYAIAYGGIAVDLTVPVLLAWRRTTALGFALAVVFHGLNAIFLNIGIFSYLAVAAITIFFAPDWPRRLWARLRRRTQPAPVEILAGAPARDARPTAARIVLPLYVVLQVLVPLRHFLYPGYVSWTEEGHRFAWHMKLRQKHSRITITVTDPDSGRSWSPDPADDLRPRQLRKLHTFPDILLQYVHFLRDRARAEGVAHPQIRVDWQCSLNWRPWQPLVDPTANLAEKERSLAHADWLLPIDPLQK